MISDLQDKDILFLESLFGKHWASTVLDYEYKNGPLCPPNTLKIVNYYEEIILRGLSVES